VEVDERELRIPLEHGWRRETVINGVSRTGLVRGEVMYYSPCGRRFKQYPDVVRVSVTVHMRFIYVYILLALYEMVKNEIFPVPKHHTMMKYRGEVVKLHRFVACLGNNRTGHVETSKFCT
jgi:hypothetical protein